MSKRQVIWVTFLVLSMLEFGKTSPTVLACTAPPGTPAVITAEERVDAAHIVVEGHVIGTYGISGRADQIAVIEVTAYYKSSGPSIISVGGYAGYPTCLSHIPSSGDHIFFVGRGPNDTLWANYLSQADAYMPATDESRRTVTEHTGRQPLAPLASQPPNLETVYEAAERPIILSPQLQTAVATWSQTPPSTSEFGTYIPSSIAQTEQARLQDGTATATPTLNPSSDDSDFVPFVLGFLAATLLFVVLGIGYWIGRRSSINPIQSS